MAEDDKDDSQKTEDPSPKRLEDALNRGQIIYSKELISFILFLGLAVFIFVFLPDICYKFILKYQKYLNSVEQIQINHEILLFLLKEQIINFLGFIILPLSLVAFAVIIATYFQNNIIVFTLEPLIPKFERISPLAGLKRIFSIKSVVELLKGMIKIIITGIACYLVIYDDIKILDIFHDYSLIVINKYILDAAKHLIIAVCIIMFFLAILDYTFQRHNYLKELRMSKQELKEEYKQAEGSPEIKAKLKRLRAEKARKRMMSQVPKADVVITNPEHYAIALKYDPQSMDAPMVIAKGMDKVAQKIKLVAKNNDIAIMENPPLARQLYKHVEINEEVPLEYYEAVAEIISYVYKLKGKEFPI